MVSRQAAEGTGGSWHFPWQRRQKDDGTCPDTAAGLIPLIAYYSQIVMKEYHFAGPH
jgi:hypothetical protein